MLPEEFNAALAAVPSLAFFFSIASTTLDARLNSAFITASEDWETFTEEFIEGYAGVCSFERAVEVVPSINMDRCISERVDGCVG